jgi:Xaa-Pro aminopeptidase
VSEPALVAARRTRYTTLLERFGAGAALLVSGPGVQHATGVRIYSQAIIPERPVVAVVGRERTILVLWEWDAPQVEAEHPGLETATFPEFGRDPWQRVAEVAGTVAGAGRRVVVEGTCPAPAVAALERVGVRASVDVGFDGFMAARTVKDRAEIGAAARAARAIDAAIAEIASRPLGGRTERAIAADIAALARAGLQGDGEVEAAGIVVGPGHLGSTHHLASTDPLAAGPIRLGLMARVDGMWSLLTRMGWAGDGPAEDAFAADYEAYIEAHTAGWRALRPGARAGEILALVHDRLARAGLRLRSPKVGHGTGLSFREAPILRADDPTPIVAGSVFAFDFAVYRDSTRSGAFIHVEDRVLVTDEGPVRLSDVTDTAVPYRIDLSPAT